MISWWISSRSSGRVERGVQQGDGLVGDLVGRGLDLVDGLHVLGQRLGPLPQIVHQGHQSPPALDDQIPMGIEQIEELGLFGHQLGEHRIPPLTIEHFNFISLWRQIRPSANW
jgi:hypothetical protein